MPVLGLLACCFAIALINANARQIGYAVPKSVKLLYVYLRPMPAHISKNYTGVGKYN